MGISALARANRIDSHVNNLANTATSTNSRLNELANSVISFAAFMHTDPEGEFSQADRDKYSDIFAETLTALQTTLSKFSDLAALEAGTMTIQEFLDSYTGDVAEYSSQFDKGV